MMFASNTWPVLKCFLVTITRLGIKQYKLLSMTWCCAVLCQESLLVTIKYAATNTLNYINPAWWHFLFTVETAQF